MKFVLNAIFIIAITTSASVLATNQVVEPNRIDHPESGKYSQVDIQKANAEWQEEQDKSLQKFVTVLEIGSLIKRGKGG